MIDSGQNKLVKYIASLSMKKVRDREGLFIVEGQRFVDEITGAFTIRQIILSQEYAAKYGTLWQKDETVPVAVVSDRIFRTVSDTVTPQGILAVVEQKKWELEHVASQDGRCLFVVAEEVADPGNLGAIIRTADAVGATAVLISKKSADVFNAKTLRATMGSIFHLPIINNVAITDLFSVFKRRTVPVAAAVLAAETSYTQLTYPDRMAIIIGNEARGVSQQTAEMADLRVKIPMPGQAESLNAAVAAGLLMYEWLRGKCP